MNAYIVSTICLVEAGKSRGDAAAAAECEAAQADVACVEVRARARACNRRVARTEVPAGGTHRDELYLAKECGLSADRRGGSRVREDVCATHVTEENRTRRGKGTVGYNPGDRDVVGVNNGGLNRDQVDIERIGRNLVETT